DLYQDVRFQAPRRIGEESIQRGQAYVEGGLLLLVRVQLVGQRGRGQQRRREVPVDMHLHAGHTLAIAESEIDWGDAAAPFRGSLREHLEGLWLGLEADDVGVRKERECFFGELSSVGADVDDRLDRETTEAQKRGAWHSIQADQVEADRAQELADR